MKQGNDYSLILCSRDLTFRAEPARVEHLAVTLSRLSAPAIVLGLNTEETAALKARGFSFIQEDTFERDAFMEDVNRAAEQTAANWFRAPRISACLTHSGVNLGETLQHPMTYFLLTPLRALALLDGLLKSKNIRTCFFFPVGSGGAEELPAAGAAQLADHWLSSQPRVSEKEKSGASFLTPFLAIAWKAVNFTNRLRNKEGKNILVSSDLKHAAPVMAELVKKGGYRFTFVREQFPVRFLKSFLGQGISLEKISAPRVAGLKLREQLSAAIEADKPFTFQGTDYFPMIRDAFLDKFVPRLEQGRGLTGAFHALAGRLEPDFILVDEDVCQYNKTLISTANQYGVPSCVIQHGAPFRIVNIALAPVTCTKIAAWGKTSKDLLIEYGVPESKIEITGVPRYDSFTSRPADPAERKQIAEALKLDASKKWLVLATDPFHEPGRADFVGINLAQNDLRELVQTAARTVDLFPDCRMILKLHPRDRYEAFAHDWIREIGFENKVCVTRTFPTPKLLPHAEILMTVCSTVAIEAMLCGKPVITVNLHNGPELQPHAELGAAIPAGSADQLAKAIDTCLHNEAEKQKLRKRQQEAVPLYIGTLDGQASKRVADLVENLIAERQAFPAGAR